jgi:gluconolactonase
MQPEVTVIASGLAFPEGPIAQPDGSIVLVEIKAGRLTRLRGGGKETIAEPGGGPNGAAIGPDGHCYVCNNGGFAWIERNGKTYPGEQPPSYSGGSIQKVDLQSGTFSTLYTQCNEEPLKGPNDIVFDAQGGFWFTDHGKNRPREKDRTGVFYALPDGSQINEVVFPLEAPNGIGLSPNEQELFVAETPTGRLWAYPLAGPGIIDADKPRRLLNGRPGFFMFDSLAVDANGDVCVATLVDGGITTLSAKNDKPSFVSMPDRVTTNICFGGLDLKTAFITLSSTGQLVSCPWPVGGLPLNFLNRKNC